MGKGRSTGHSSRMDSMVVARRAANDGAGYDPADYRPGPPPAPPSLCFVRSCKGRRGDGCCCNDSNKSLPHASHLRPGRQSSWSPKFPFTVTPTITNPIIKALFRLRVSACVSIFCWSARRYFEVRAWARGEDIQPVHVVFRRNGRPSLGYGKRSLNRRCANDPEDVSGGSCCSIALVVLHPRRQCSRRMRSRVSPRAGRRMRAKWAGRSRSSGRGCPSCRGTSTSCRRTPGGVRCWNALASATEALRNSLTGAITRRAYRTSSPI